MQARREALFDEISKVAAAAKKPDYLEDKKKPLWKRRMAYHIAGGAGAAIGSGLLGTLADKGIEKILGSEKYKKMPDAMKLKFLLPVTALSIWALREARKRKLEARAKYPK